MRLGMQPAAHSWTLNRVQGDGLLLTIRSHRALPVVAAADTLTAV